MDSRFFHMPVGINDPVKFVGEGSKRSEIWTPKFGVSALKNKRIPVAVGLWGGAT